MEDTLVENVAVYPFFLGSIAEAIQIAKSEKKSLIVYIAGENEDSSRMDQTTWKDQKVQELIREQFVALHLKHRSSDAAHFFAMYPYDGVPIISVINIIGMLLKQLGGYVGPEELFRTLEQSLAVQAAATIVAALASANNSSSTARPTQSQARSTSIVPESLESQEEGSCSAVGDHNEACIPATAAPTDEKLVDNIVQIDHKASTPRNGQHTNTEAQEEKRESHLQKQTAVLKPGRVEDRTKQVLDSASYDLLPYESMPQIAATSRGSEKEINDQVANMDATLSLEAKASSLGQEKAPKIKQPPEMFLIQVRLTNGKSIRESFNPKDNLAVVKKFVDQNRDDGNGLYSLAMLYPRKVFSQEDMEKSLLELNVEDRATLVLVTSPSQQEFSASEGSSRQAAEVKDSGTSGGMWKILSYFNPLAYFSGSSDNSNNDEPENSSWQYEPNPNLRNAVRQGTPERDGLSSPTVNETNASKRKKAQDKNWGGNIHMLHRNDNDEAFKRGNTFWNGNSTQFGGEDSQK